MKTTANVTCPECDTVLRPSKPLQPGKSVKCPKCGAGFVVGADRTHSAGVRAASPAQKKPTAGVVPVAPVKRPHDDDDDDEGGGGTYAFKSEEESKGADIDYAPDMGVRDLRGPAMTEVVDPSNKLIMVGASGFLGWSVFLVVLTVPILFPLETKEDRAKIMAKKMHDWELKKNEAIRNHQTLPPEPKLDETSFFQVGDIDLRAIGEWPWYLAIFTLVPMLLGMVYSAVLCVGAVKIQNLESRTWGLMASVMAMIPYNAGGLLCMLALVMNIVLGFMFDDGELMKWIFLGFFLVAAWGTNLAVGIWMLTVLNKPDVIAGYEYVAE